MSSKDNASALSISANYLKGMVRNENEYRRLTIEIINVNFKSLFLLTFHENLLEKGSIPDVGSSRNTILESPQKAIARLLIT